MSDKVFEIKEGIKLHVIKSDKYKTDFNCIILTTPLKRETVTTNALVPFLVRRGTENYPSLYKLDEEFERLYGATFNCGIDKNGDNVILKFCVESISNEYSLNNEDVLKKSLDILFEIAFNPIRKNGLLNEEFLEIEKSNLKDVIESKIDDKDAYAYNNCIAAMFGEEKYGLYKYGYVEDIDSITIESVTEYYDWLINNCKIDIFVSGNNNEEEIKNDIESNENIQKLNPREGYYIYDGHLKEIKEEKDVKYVTESMNVTQGKLILGYDITNCKMEDYKYIGTLYNSILGDGANSMMFQNVREKASLCYTIKSVFVPQKATVFLRSGIQIENYDKALELIQEQFKNMAEGKFTEDDVEESKTYIYSALNSVSEEQDTQIVYYLGQELSKAHLSVEEYREKIAKVTKEDIVNFAKNIRLNTVYFLKD